MKSQSVSCRTVTFSYATATRNGATSGKPHPTPSHQTRNARLSPRANCVRESRRAYASEIENCR